MAPRMLRVKNWETHQHYKDRDPAWIKLYYAVLDDYAWAALPDVAKAHLAGIWLLASRNRGLIPDDATWIARRIGAQSKVNLALLIEAGFLEQDASTTLAGPEQRASKVLAKPEHVSSPRALAREEKRREEKNGASRTLAREAFDTAWSTYPRRPGDSRANAWKSWQARIREGVAPDAMLAGVRAYAAYLERERLRPDWDPRFIKQGATFFGPGRHWESDYGPPADELIEVYDERGEFTPAAAALLR